MRYGRTNTPRIFALGLLACFPDPNLSAQQYSTDEVVAMVAEAMGGADRIDRFATLRFDRVYATSAYPIFSVDIERPEKVRMESDTIVFVLDGSRTCRMSRLPGEDGQPQVPELLDSNLEAVLRREIAIPIPAFFDYEPEYLGIRVVGEIEGHVLQVRLPEGGWISYLIDRQSHLPLMASISAGVDQTEPVFRMSYHEFREVHGIRLPHAVHYDGKLSYTMQNVQVDTEFPDDRFGACQRL